MATGGIVGHKGFDSMKEIAKEYPHKWGSSTLYRDMLRMINRKYDEPKRSVYLKHLRSAFREHGYINDQMRLKLMGSGPTTIGSLAIEEEFYLKNIKHPEHPTKHDLIDIVACAMNNKRPHPLPYVMQRDMWYYFGLTDSQQNDIASKMSGQLKEVNRKYTDETIAERDECREWLLKRLEIFEKTHEIELNKKNEKKSESTKKEENDKIETIFNYLDSDKDGKIHYTDVLHFIDNARLKNEEESDNREWVYWVDNITMCPESWYYMCDLIEPPQPIESSQTTLSTQGSDTNETNNENKTNKSKKNKKKDEFYDPLKDPESFLYQYYNPTMTTPPYESGWTIDHLKDAYLKFEFFNLDGHYQLYKKLSEKNDKIVLPSCDRMYNLFCEVSLNVPSICIIPQHGIATGKYLYQWILHESGLDEYDRIDTWDELEAIHEKLGTKHLIEQAKESEEILPADIVYFDPESMESDITDKLPRDSIYWHVVFESKIPDIPHYITDAYWEEVVIPKLMEKDESKYNELYFAKLEYNKEEKYKEIENFVFSEMENWMQKWVWNRFTQMNQKPAFGVSTWNDTHLRHERTKHKPKTQTMELDFTNLKLKPLHD